MVSEKVTVRNPNGLHLRPAGVLCEEAVKYKSAIRFRTASGKTAANAKSVLSVLGACVKYNGQLEFICEGEDEEEALAAMVKAVQEGLGEDITC